MNLPYSISNFTEMRRGGYFYVDKTGFIPLLEDPARGRHFALFLRPRRMGKSLLVSTLVHYYFRELGAQTTTIQGVRGAE